MLPGVYVRLMPVGQGLGCPLGLLKVMLLCGMPVPPAGDAPGDMAGQSRLHTALWTLAKECSSAWRVMLPPALECRQLPLRVCVCTQAAMGISSHRWPGNPVVSVIGEHQ